MCFGIIALVICLMQIYHRLDPGDAITLNNRRFLHSRTAFKTNGGKQHLQVLVATLVCVQQYVVPCLQVECL